VVEEWSVEFNELSVESSKRSVSLHAEHFSFSLDVTSRTSPIYSINVIVETCGQQMLTSLDIAAINSANYA